MTLSLDTAYRSFGGEVEASSTPTICRLLDSRRHQLSAIAPASAPVPMTIAFTKTLAFPETACVRALAANWPTVEPAMPAADTNTPFWQRNPAILPAAPDHRPPSPALAFTVNERMSRTVVRSFFIGKLLSTKRFT